MKINILEVPQIVLTLELKDKCFDPDYLRYNFRFDNKEETSAHKRVRYVFPNDVSTEALIKIVNKIDISYINEYNINILFVNKVIKPIDLKELRNNKLNS